MPMLLIQGSFQILGAQPDGDSIHFTPDDPTEWDLVGGPNPVQRNGVGRNQLRLDAVDALETHYGPHRDHQPPAFAHAAADELLAWLGYTGVTRAANETITAATPAEVPGYILTRNADKYGRCVSFVGKGTPPADSGTQVSLDVPLLRTTVNHHLLTTGLVYPTYYTGLFPDLRDELTAVTAQARSAGLGLWPQEATTTGAKVTGLASVTDDVVILPKLFRRLVDYLHLGDSSLTGFPAFLDQRQDKFVILSTGHFSTGLDLIVDVTNGNQIRMTRPVEDLVFDEG
jgi:endonuclease YncB( thermonuclease family)